MGEMSKPEIPCESALSPYEHISFLHLLARNCNNSHFLKKSIKDVFKRDFSESVGVRGTRKTGECQSLGVC